MNSQLLKRLFDITAALSFLIIFAPVIFGTALIVLFSMNRPILFRQRRIGAGGRAFTLLKFRTMMNGDRPDEERLTRVGRLLRQYSLDEFPQLINVVIGEMSLVGPRPLLPHYLPRYSVFQWRRHEVKPGITGWAQMNGRNAVSWDLRFELDVWYVDHWSFWLDLKILLATLAKVIRREGVSHDGHATMPEFMGSAEAPEQ